MTDILLSIGGALFIIAGLIGCIVPLLPGPPMSYIGFLFLQFKTIAPFTTSFLVWWAVIVAVITVLDYVIPIYGTKKFGGSRMGIWGCVFGLFVGLWFGPIGIIFGPFVGAFVGEVINSSDRNQAFKAALGSFIGFLFGTLMKLVACFVMTWYFIAAL